MSQTKLLGAYVVTKHVGSDKKERTYWNRVATAIPNGDGKGHNLVIPPGVTLSGTIVLREFKADNEDQSDGEGQPA